MWEGLDHRGHLCYNIGDIFYVQYFDTQINNNQMQREQFNNMLVSLFQLQPFEGGRDADVAHVLRPRDTGPQSKRLREMIKSKKFILR